MVKQCVTPHEAATHSLSIEEAEELTILPEDSFAIYKFLNNEIQERMGRDFVSKMPIDLMEKYCLATVINNHPTAELLHELVTNFLIAYSSPDTQDEAIKALDYLGHFADKVKG